MDIGKFEFCFQWDDEVIEFIELFEYYGYEKIINLFCGFGFLGIGKGGEEVFDWVLWNWFLFGKIIRKKNCIGYIIDSGLYKNLLQSFFELVNEENFVVILFVDNDIVKVILIVLKKDGMVLILGM